MYQSSRNNFVFLVLFILSLNVVCSRFVLFLLRLLFLLKYYSVNSLAALFNFTPVDPESDSMIAST